MVQQLQSGDGLICWSNSTAHAVKSAASTLADHTDWCYENGLAASSIRATSWSKGTQTKYALLSRQRTVTSTKPRRSWRRPNYPDRLQSSINYNSIAPGSRAGWLQSHAAVVTITTRKLQQMVAVLPAIKLGRLQSTAITAHYSHPLQRSYVGLAVYTASPYSTYSSDDWPTTSMDDVAELSGDGK